MAATDMVDTDMAVDTMGGMDTTMERDLLMPSLDMEATDMVDTVMAVDTMEGMDITMARDLLSLPTMADMDMVDMVMVMDMDMAMVMDTMVKCCSVYQRVQCSKSNQIC